MTYLYRPHTFFPMQNSETSPKNLFFTTNLKHLRKSRGLSQEAFALKVGLNRGNIVSYEKGAAEPNIRNLIRIAEFLEITIEDLVKIDFRNSTGLYPKSNSSTPQRRLQVILTEPEVKEMVARSQSLLAIIQGTGHYHALKSNASEEERTLNPEAMMIDVRRCIEVADALVKMNQDILNSINVNN